MIDELEKGDEWIEYSRRMLAALKSNNPLLARDLYREAQAKGHRFPDVVPRLIQEAVAARNSSERNRILRTLAESMATVLGRARTRTAGGSTTRPPSGDRGVAPVSTPIVIPFFGYVQEGLKAYARRTGADVGRRYGSVFDVSLTHGDLRMELHPRSGDGSLRSGGIVVFPAPVRFPVSIGIRKQGRQIPPIRLTWYLSFKRGVLNPDGTGGGRLVQVFSFRVPGSEAEFREQDEGSWRMAPAGANAFWLYIISRSGHELPRAFLLRRLR
jgi:hypothetical protein